MPVFLGSDFGGAAGDVIRTPVAINDRHVFVEDNRAYPAVNRSEVIEFSTRRSRGMPWVGLMAHVLHGGLHTSTVKPETMRKFEQFYIDGEWVDPVESRPFGLVNPATAETFGEE